MIRGRRGEQTVFTQLLAVDVKIRLVIRPCSITKSERERRIEGIRNVEREIARVQPETSSDEPSGEQR